MLRRDVKARIIIRFFDLDTTKADRLRAAMQDRLMIRRDAQGRKIVELVVRHEKRRGPPPGVGGRL